MKGIETIKAYIYWCKLAGLVPCRCESILAYRDFCEGLCQAK